MKKYLAVFMMSILCLMSFHASGQSTVEAYINVDNHNAVYMTYYDTGYNTVTYNFPQDGINHVTWTTHSPSFQIIAYDGYEITKVMLGSTDDSSSISGDRYYGSTNNGWGGTSSTPLTVTTSGGGGSQTTATVTINIDNPSLVQVYNCPQGDAWQNIPLSLSKGNNQISFNPTTGSTFFIQSGDTKLTSVTYNDNSVSYIEHYGYEITNVTDKSNITIVATDPNATLYHVSFASGTNVDAISGVRVGNNNISGYQNGFDVNPGESVGISFLDTYDITNVTINNVPASLSYGAIYMDNVQEDKVIAFSATSNVTQNNTVYFNISGSGLTLSDALTIYRGTSTWDPELTLSSSFTDEFSESPQNYFIKANDGYRITSINKSGTNVAVLGYGNTLELVDGDVVNIVVEEYNPEALRTSTLTIYQSSTQYFKTPIVFSGGAYTAEPLVGDCTTTVKFNPDESAENTFKVRCEDPLYSVYFVRGGNTTTLTYSSATQTYSFTAQDGDALYIVARDPNAAPPVITYANINFGNGTSGMSQLMVNNEAASPVDNVLTTDHEDLVTLVTTVNQNANPHVYYLPIVKGVSGKSSMTDAQWDAYWNAQIHYYEHELDKNKEHPVVPDLSTAENADINTYKNMVPFSAEPTFFTNSVTCNFYPTVNASDDNIYVTFKEYTYQLNYTNNVTFNITGHQGVDITDVTDSNNRTAIAAMASFTHNFNWETPFIDIDPKTGFKLTSVMVNDGSSTSERLGSEDTYVHNLLVGNGYSITITAEKIGGGESTDNYTITVIGDPKYINMQNASTYASVDLESGANVFTADGTQSFYIASTMGLDDFYGVFYNGTPLQGNGYYYEVTLAADDHLMIYTEAIPTFTVEVSGDLSRIDVLQDEDENDDEYIGTIYPLLLGENTLTVSGKQYVLYLKGDEPLFSVKLNGIALSKVKIGRSDYGYKFTPANGDVLVIRTDAPTTPNSFTVNVTGDASKIAYIMGEDRVQHALALGENTFTLANNYDEFKYMLVADGEYDLYSVKVNGVEQGAKGQYILTVVGGDVVDIDTEFPVGNATINWNFAGDASSALISSIKVGDVGPLTADDEGFSTYTSSFQVPYGTKIEYVLNTKDYKINSVQRSGVDVGTGANQFFTVTANTVITVDATLRKVFDYTLTTNMPGHTLVYNDKYGIGQAIALNGQSTTVEYNEISGKTNILIGADRGFIVESVKVGSELYTEPIEEGGARYFNVEPVKDATVVVKVAEKPRPYSAMLYIDDLSKFEQLSLTRATAVTVFNIKEPDCMPANGFNVFHFDDEDVAANASDGGFNFFVQMPDGAPMPHVYLNDVEQTLTEGSLRGIKSLKDGDVIKVITAETPLPMCVAPVVTIGNAAVVSGYTYNLNDLLTIESATPGARISYAMYTGDPGDLSMNTYEAPVALSKLGDFNFIVVATADGYAPSAQTSFTVSVVNPGSEHTEADCVVYLTASSQGEQFYNYFYPSEGTVTWTATNGVKFETSATKGVGKSFLPQCREYQLQILNGDKNAITIKAPHGYGFKQIKFHTGMYDSTNDYKLKINVYDGRTTVQCLVVPEANSWDGSTATFNSTDIPAEITFDINDIEYPADWGGISFDRIEFVLDITGVDTRENDYATVIGELSDYHPANYVDADGKANHVVVNDATDYTVASEITTGKLSYSRTINQSSLANAAWQALYVPFAISKAEWEEFASQVIRFSGVTDDDQLEFEEVTGDLTANTLYIFKPKASIAIDRQGSGISVLAGADNSVSYESKDGSKRYTLTGTYTYKTDMHTCGAYALSGGRFLRANSDAAVLKPFRVFLTITDLTSGEPAIQAPPRVSIKVKSGATSEIETIEASEIEEGIYYNLQGMPVTNPGNGFYIHNGRKVYIK